MTIINSLFALIAMFHCMLAYMTALHLLLDNSSIHLFHPQTKGSVKESGTECSHVCSFAVFSRFVIGSVQLL